MPVDTYGSLVRLRPRDDRVYIGSSRTLLVTDSSGGIVDGEHGLWVRETRVLSRHRWLVDGEPPLAAGGSPVAMDRWVGYSIANASRRGAGGEANPAQSPIELHLARTLQDGMSEDVTLTNHTQQRRKIVLALELDADFAAPQEKKARRRQQGRLTRSWDSNDRTLTFDYLARHRFRHGGDRGLAELRRGLLVTVQYADSAVAHRRGSLVFVVSLAAHATWRARLRYTPVMEAEALAPSIGGRSRDPLAEMPRFDAPSRASLATVVLASLERAERDLAGLRLRDLDGARGAWTFAGGLPTYQTFFGRDTLHASRAGAMLGPELIEGALRVLALTQARVRDDWRDEQPGRMVHELHEDPLAALRYEPHGRYYGDVGASLQYPIALETLFRWTGDAALVRSYVEPALAAMAWADRVTLGSDGFYRYATFSSQGEKNQGWKDSSDAIVWPDGSQVEDPVGTCEMQAFAYRAKRSLAALLAVLGRHEDASRLLREARALKKRFDEVFWMEDEGYFGMAIDGRGVLVRTIASDPGHCIGSGIVERERLPRLVARLLAPDLFSGWGVRTLSSNHPAYDPFAYHRGTVWPVENATFAVGLARHGFVQDMHALCKAQFEAAALFDHARLPELFSGHARDAAHPFPALYPRADWPQAWSATAVLGMLDAMLGLSPDASLQTLTVNPKLPEWLPEITVRGLRVGRATVSLRFVRADDGPHHEVLACEGPLRVIERDLPVSDGTEVRSSAH